MFGVYSIEDDEKDEEVALECDDSLEEREHVVDPRDRSACRYGQDQRS